MLSSPSLIGNRNNPGRGWRHTLSWPVVLITKAARCGVNDQICDLDHALSHTEGCRQDAEASRSTNPLDPIR